MFARLLVFNCTQQKGFMKNASYYTYIFAPYHHSISKTSCFLENGILLLYCLASRPTDCAILLVRIFIKVEKLEMNKKNKLKHEFSHYIFRYIFFLNFLLMMENLKGEKEFPAQYSALEEKAKLSVSLLYYSEKNHI